MYISCWHNCLQCGEDDGFQTKVQVLQVTHNNPSGQIEGINIHSQRTLKHLAQKPSNRSVPHKASLLKVHLDMTQKMINCNS